MRRFLATIIFVLFVLAVQYASASSLLMLGAGTPTVAASYVGPGNVVASSTAWYGLRAYSTADRGNALINVCNVSDVVCADMSSDATTGALVIATIGGSSCSVVVCTIKTFYDRSGNGKNVTQATISKRFTLTVSCVNSKPCAVALGSSSQCYLASSTITATSSTAIFVGIRTGAFTTQATVLGDDSDHIEFGYLNATNKVYLSGPVTAANITASDSAWHAVQGVSVSASGSSITVDGSTTGSLNTGTAAYTGRPVLGAYGSAGPACGGQYLTGSFVEGGYWASAFSAGDLTAMDSNMRTYWGI